MAEKWIQGAIKHPGAFTAQAKSAGMGTQAYAKKVGSAPEGKFSSTTRRRAALARRLSAMSKGR